MRYSILILLLSALMALLFALSLLVGPAAIAFGDSMAALFSGKGGATVLVMREIRLPRAILGLTIGASLGLSGAALQGYLRNPLAEPGLIGVSSCAALGAVVAIYTGLSAAFPLALPLFALAGAFVSVLVLLSLSAVRGGSLTMILAGVAISALAAALTSLALSLSPNPFAALEIVFWLLGSLTDRSMDHVVLAVPFMIIGWMLIAGLGRGLDALTLGEDAAASLGVRLDLTRLALVLGVASSVGAATAVAGAIGFVGLVVPHLLRPLVGAHPSRLLLASALGGAAMLLAADLAVRLLSEGRELKLGVLTALIGAPFFLRLILTSRRQLS